MNTVILSSRGAHKTFGSVTAYETELWFLQQCPWASMHIVKLLPESLTIVTEVGEAPNPTQEVVNATAHLLLKLARVGIHHRDAHPGNIVLLDGDVRLIDWETGYVGAGKSYDLYGPVDIPVPVQHGGLIPQWWESNDAGSIKNVWKAYLPDWAQRSG